MQGATSNSIRHTIIFTKIEWKMKYSFPKDRYSQCQFYIREALFPDQMETMISFTLSREDLLALVVSKLVSLVYESLRQN